MSGLRYLIAEHPGISSAVLWILVALVGALVLGQLLDECPDDTDED
jgi:hypothetical protein